MLARRSFLTRTLGVIAGAVCAPFVGKAAGDVLIPHSGTYTLPQDPQWFKVGFIYNPQAPAAERLELYIDDAPVSECDWFALHEAHDGTVMFEARVKPDAADPGAT